MCFAFANRRHGARRKIARRARSGNGDCADRDRGHDARAGGLRSSRALRAGATRDRSRRSPRVAVRGAGTDIRHPVVPFAETRETLNLKPGVEG